METGVGWEADNREFRRKSVQGAVVPHCTQVIRPPPPHKISSLFFGIGKPKVSRL